MFSDKATLSHIASLLKQYKRLPFGGSDTIPGSTLESVLEHVRGFRRLGKYSFIDLVSDSEPIGWQVKSSKVTSPLTWQRAKVSDAGALREASKKFPTAAQSLGRLILDYVNEHARKSLHEHGLDRIGYSRLVIAGARAFYFERELISKKNPVLFDPEAFTWRWADDRKAVKEQKGSLGAYDVNGIRWFSWHSENQLHFENERAWWPQENSDHRIDFEFSPNKISVTKLIEWIDNADADQPLGN